MHEVRILKIPAIGQTFSRELMPQLSDNLEDFLKFLDANDIKHHERQDIDPSKLKATQANGFDYDKIMSIPPGETHKIIISNDLHVIDGHNRWLAAHNRDDVNLKCHEVDLPIVAAVAKAKEYLAAKNLQEGITRKEFQPMVDSFVDFASSELGIKSLPNIQYKDSDENDDQPSFGGYCPGSKTITVSTKNRHPMDIFRTIAHELVHSKQDEDGRLKDVAKEGSTGSDIENEANSQAGIIMRKHAKNARHMFKVGSLDEAFEEMLQEDSPSDREWGKPSLTATYKKDTPGQNNEDEIDEEGILDTASGAVGLSKGSDGIGPEFGVSNFGPGGLGSAFSYGTVGGLNSSVGESFDSGAFDMGTVPKQGSKEEVKEESPVWQRKEGQDPKGGLNRKGIKAYRRENPGSKLSMAVTEKPSKLKKGSKKWKRRKSFCARMGGVDGPMKDEKGRPTRKALALRKWNCE
jgi:hypothetical protein